MYIQYHRHLLKKGTHCWFGAFRQNESGAAIMIKTITDTMTVCQAMNPVRCNITSLVHLFIITNNAMTFIFVIFSERALQPMSSPCCWRASSGIAALADVLAECAAGPLTQ